MQPEKPIGRRRKNKRRRRSKKSALKSALS
jgi:hypothetical protein